MGKKEGAQILTGGTPRQMPGDMSGGCYIPPTIFKGNNKMRIFQVRHQIHSLICNDQQFVFLNDLLMIMYLFVFAPGVMCRRRSSALLLA